MRSPCETHFALVDHPHGQSDGQGETGLGTRLVLSAAAVTSILLWLAATLLAVQYI